MIHTEARDTKGKEEPRDESWGSEWTPWPNLSLRLRLQFMSNGITYTKFVLINIDYLHGLVMFH